MSLQLAYYLALAALSLGVALQGTGPMKRTAFVIWAVAVASLLLTPLWPSTTYSFAMIVVDALAAVAILYHPAGRWQSAIGLTYVFQIAFHIGRLINASDADINSFYIGLSVLAVLQLALVGGWLFGGGFLYLVRWGGLNKSASHSRRQGVE